uniref:Immunoglobulin heavy variable 4-2 n=1 Tax=Cyprinus carpio TaxID=7962 RepID=A0A8C2DHU0_CYPCA
MDLSCRGSGFTFRSYDMHWVRQKPGKALVWMGHVWINLFNVTDVNKTFKHWILTERRLEITRDDSKSMMYLKLSGLTEEDSGMYFCARQAQ